MRGPKDAAPVTQTPPLSRAGRKLAETALAAASFRPTVDGKRMVRQYEVYGIAVAEWVNVPELKWGK